MYGMVTLVSYTACQNQSEGPMEGFPATVKQATRTGSIKETVAHVHFKPRCPHLNKQHLAPTHMCTHQVFC